MISRVIMLISTCMVLAGCMCDNTLTPVEKIVIKESEELIEDIIEELVD